jgi:hypothetical protein
MPGCPYVEPQTKAAASGSSKLTIFAHVIYERTRTTLFANLLKDLTVD